MSRTHHAAALVTAALALALVLPAPSSGQAVPSGSCQGIADYADEITLGSFAVTSQTPLPGGISRVELSLEASNLGAAQFRSAEATPDFTGLDLDLVAEPVAASFGAIADLGVAAASVPLVVELPTARIPDLESALATGTVPFTVHAFEETILAPGVEVRSWSSAEEQYWVVATDPAFAGIDQDPPPPPYQDDQEFAFLLIALFDDADSVLDDFQPGDEFYLREDTEQYPLTEIPVPLRNVRVVSVTKSDESGDDDGTTQWSVRVQRTLADDLPAVVETGSFCSGESAHIDSPVQATRLQSIDGADVPAEERDANVHPIRFNDLPFAGGLVSVSGQVQGHVIKPSIELRLRGGAVRARIDVDTELSMSAEMRVHGEADFTPEDLELYDLCFPLPDLPLGPVTIPMNLTLRHTVGAQAHLQAGAVVGLQKSHRAGFTLEYDGSQPVGSRYQYTPRNDSVPVSFTPPRLTDDTAANARVETRIRAALRAGARYPLCETGPGAFLEATAYGSLDVTPTQDPWWHLGHGGEVVAGVDLQILGLEIASHQSQLFPFLGKETREADPGVASGAPAAAAAFAAASGPAGPAARTEGLDQRWSVIIDDIDDPGGFNATASAELSDGSIVLVSKEGTQGGNRLIKLDRYGAFQWSVTYRGGRLPRRVLALPDDTILVGGEVTWLAKHAADGTLLWDSKYDVGTNGVAGSGCTLRDMALLPDPAGQTGAVIVGSFGTGSVRTRDACALRVDASGNLLWARSYNDTGAQQFHGVTATSDGHLAVAGRTEVGVDVFSENNGLIAKLDIDGNVLWAKSLPTFLRGSELNAITEGDDGVLFAAGYAARTIRQTGAAMVARIGLDGEDARHALLFQDEVSDADFDFDVFVDTGGGDTPWDRLYDIAAVPGGVVVVGTTGIYDDEKAGWAAKLDAKLGAEWFLTLDGAGGEHMDGVTRSADGLLVSGTSRGRNGLGEDGEQMLWLSKLPFEGRIELLPQYGYTTRYVEPGIRFSSTDESVAPGGIASIDAPLLVIDSDVFDVGPIDDLLVSPSRLCITQLTESGLPSTLDACIEDADDDGVADDVDNCTDVPNADQADIDAGADDDASLAGVQHYGDACDVDLDDDGIVGTSDWFGVFRPCLGATTATDPNCTEADLDGDGLVGSADFFGWLRPAFGTTPGPGHTE